MGIVLDTNCIHCIFKNRDKNYAPVLTWILSSEGKIVMGGTKYEKEFTKKAFTGKYYLRLFNNLKKQGKIVRIDNSKVDAQEKRILESTTNSACDDQHIIALVSASNCRVVCSNDKRATKYLKDPDLYPKRVKPPSIYKYSTHSHLLGKKYTGIPMRNVVA